jgi:NADPH:quinone reductase-like Zn-dependent oxidoreductase
MKAAVYTTYGPPEVVKIMEVDKPVPRDKEILIKVHTTTVNRTDCGFRSAEYFVSRFWSGLIRPKYKVLGCEFAGEITGLGKAVRSFSVGDKVFGFNDITFGAHAEYMSIPEDAAMTTIPEGMTYEEAAPITEGSHYALCSIRAAKVASGQHVLVYGATGAIGSAAVQLAKYFGARVTAVCHGRHIGLVKSLGADEVIDYTSEDFTKTDQKFDFAFDAVGKTFFGKCKPLLTKKGIYISTELGKNGGNIFLAIATPLFNGKKVLFPIPTISREDVEFLRELVMSGRFRPVVDRRYDMEDIVEAYRYVETGQKTGNVILRIADRGIVK